MVNLKTLGIVPKVEVRLDHLGSGGAFDLPI